MRYMRWRDGLKSPVKHRTLCGADSAIVTTLHCVYLQREKDSQKLIPKLLELRQLWIPLAGFLGILPMLKSMRPEGHAVNKVKLIISTFIGVGSATKSYVTNDYALL